MTKFLQRCRGAGGKRPPHMGVRAILLGGLGGFLAIGSQPWVLALAVGSSIAAMMATRTVHPPAGSNPVIVFLGHSGWGFFLFPVLCGAVILVLIAWAYNNAVRKTPYPLYW
jgi:CBS-domain-containing membrane protein